MAPDMRSAMIGAGFKDSTDNKQPKGQGKPARPPQDRPRSGREKDPVRVLPLYKHLKDVREFPGAPHPGLIFDKYPNIWSCNPNWKREDKAKNDFFECVIEYANSPEIGSYLTAHIDRHKELVDNCGGEHREFSTDWRFVTGLGMGHVIETGFVWHRTLGVPYLPGSSVKGMLRAWAECELGRDGAKRIMELFGPNSDLRDSKSSAGRLIVFDALPSTRPKIELDVMNPHYSEYYMKDKPPADYLSPVPIFFLAVASGQKFLFSLAPRPGAGTQDDVKEGMHLLVSALDQLGAGAKTSVGYGYMTEVK